MRSFTILDFLKLNSPCFCCGEPIEVGAYLIGSSITGTVYLKPNMSKTHLSVDLSIKYETAISLSIDLKTNKFVASCPMKTLASFFKDRKLSIETQCRDCSGITSDTLSFNFYKAFIKPVEVAYEWYWLRHKNHVYVVSSGYDEDITKVMLTTYSGYDKIASETTYNYPLIPRYRFKDRQAMIDKLKLYTALS
jgi:hypothetical protein